MYNFTIFPHLRELLSVIKGCYNVIKCYKCSLFSFNFQPAFYSSLTFANNFWWPCHIIIIIITTTTIKFSLTWSIVNGQETDICGCCCCHYPAKNGWKSRKNSSNSKFSSEQSAAATYLPVILLMQIQQGKVEENVFTVSYTGNFFSIYIFRRKKTCKCRSPGRAYPLNFSLSSSLTQFVVSLLAFFLQS